MSTGVVRAGEAEDRTTVLAEGHRAIDIWIGDPDYLGQGYGTQMMELAIERSFADPSVTAILVDPLEQNGPAHRFYERLGFEASHVGFKLFL